MTPALKNLLLLLAALQQFVASHPASLPVTPAPKSAATAKTVTAAAPASAASFNRCPAGTKNFGGQIIIARPCCNGLNLVIGPPTGGTYLFDPLQSSQCLFDNRALHSGAWVLGSASSFGYCQELPTCNVYTPTDGIITMIGTSQ